MIAASMPNIAKAVRRYKLRILNLFGKRAPTIQQRCWCDSWKTRAISLYYVTY